MYCAFTLNAKSRLVFIAAVALLLQTAPAQNSSANLIVQVGHTPRVNAVAISADGKYGLTGGDDSYARLWELQTGLELRHIESKYGVERIAMTPDAHWALISDDHDVSLWDLSMGRRVREISDPSVHIPGGLLALSGDAHWALTGSSDGNGNEGVFLWNLRDSGDPPKALPLDLAKKVGSIAITPDGRWALTGGFGPSSISFDLHKADQIARLWDFTSMQEVKQFQITRNLQGKSEIVPIGSVAITSDGMWGLTGSSDGLARLWDLKSGKQLKQLKGHTGEVSVVQLTPDGKLALTGSLHDRTVRLWDLGSGRQLRKIEVQSEVELSIAISADGKRALIGTDAAAVIVWNLEGPQETTLLQGSEAVVRSVAISSDGHWILTGCDDNTLRLWDVERGNQTNVGAQDGPFDAVAMTPNARWALTSGKDNTALLWDLSSQQTVHVLKGHEGSVTAAAITPDGNWGLTGSSDGKAIAWDLDSGKELCRMDTGENRYGAAVDLTVALTSDGRWGVIAGDTKPTSVWDLHGCKETRRIAGTDGRAAPLAVSADGDLIALGSVSGDISVWDMSQVDWLHDQIVETTDGFLLATPNGGLDGGPYPTREAAEKAASMGLKTPGPATLGSGMWHPDGHGIVILKGGEVTNSLVITPDGRFVAAAADDKTVRLWDAQTGAEVKRFEKSRSSNGGYHLAATSNAGLIVIGVRGATTLWNTANDRSLQLVSYKGGGWAVVDLGGRFDSSDLDEGPPLHWVTSDDPMHALPLEMFMRDYYTPRLLTRFLNGEETPPLPSIGDIKNRVQPEVAIVKIEPSPQSVGRVNVSVRAASRTEKGQASGLQDLRLFRDGQLVGNGYREGPLKDGTYVFENVRLSLSRNKTTFTAYALNSARIKSPTVQLDYSYTPATSAKPKAWLVQIGVNHYQAEGCDLRYAVNDARKLRQALESRLKSRGMEVEAAELTAEAGDSTATRDRIRATLEVIAKDATPDDAFFLSFSGHGYTTADDQFYILPSDIPGACDQVDAIMLKKAISADELADWLRPIDAGEMTFILDSCYSAKSVEANEFKPGPMGSRGLGQLAYDKRMRILAASQSDQAAGEYAALGDGQGLLTYVLTDIGLGRGEADWRPIDKRITIGEWLAFGADRVPKQLENGLALKESADAGRGFKLRSTTRHAAQIPALFDFTKQDNFLIGTPPSK